MHIYVLFYTEWGIGALHCFKDKSFFKQLNKKALFPFQENSALFYGLLITER